MKYLVTGAAGFIGFHISIKLLEKGFAVVGVDNINSYYSPQLKHDRLSELMKNPLFVFIEGDIANGQLWDIIKEDHPEIRKTIHLAAQAGVRYSIENPRAYVHSNLVGFGEVLEYVRVTKQEHLVYASSSSVYGNSSNFPYTEKQSVDEPISFYAATKKANELMAHTYTHLYKIPTTGLRFFTVYGPWGRPDMAVWLFTDAIMNDKPIKVFNEGKLCRDFTFIDDIVNGIIAVESRNNLQSEPYKIYNIGNNKPEQVNSLLDKVQNAVGKTACINYEKMQPGDVYRTEADITQLKNDLGWEPSTSLEVGITKFVSWFKDYKTNFKVH